MLDQLWEMCWRSPEKATFADWKSCPHLVDGWTGAVVVDDESWNTFVGTLDG